MVILTAIRQSPAYLYIKTYCICALVTLFQASPVSSRLPRVGETLQLSKYRIVNTRLGPRIFPVDRDDAPGREPQSLAQVAKQLVISPELAGPWASQSRVREIVRRWYHRAVDLAQLKRLLRRDDADVRAYPELNWDATVRRSSALHAEERRFTELRKHRISSNGRNSLHGFLRLPKDHKVDPRDVPLVALGGSGGGYRAMYGLTSFISASKKLGLWDCITWVAGVSGSCWTIAAYYTIAYHDVSRLTQHYLSMAREVAHPMSIYALNTVARSSRGVYFLIGPLVRKARNGIIGLGMMDLYATLTTTYQFISREPRARLSRATFQWSKVWSRSGLDRGAEPMPILTAVRRAPKDSAGVKPHGDSSISKGHPPKRALTQHQTHASDAIASARPQPARRAEESPNFFQWFEISPLEIGSPEAHGYIPTWSWGRTFAAGRSIGRAPEQSLSLLLGQCTSAPAGPLTAYISALLASMPKGTAMSRLLLLLNNFARMKRWERLWGNPIRAGHDPNPFYGSNAAFPSDMQSSSQVQVVGVGVSSVDPDRLDRMAKRQRPGSGDPDKRLWRLAKRILGGEELEQVTGLLAGVGHAEGRRKRFQFLLSVTWAAKMAVHKALHPQYAVSWHDLVMPASFISPNAHLDQSIRASHVGFSEDWLSQHGARDVPSVRLNMSHDGGRFIANAVAECGLGFRRQPPGANRDQLSTAASHPAADALGAGAGVICQDVMGPDVRQFHHTPAPPNAVADNDSHASRARPWESQGRVRLMDSGMSNNLPNHILARPERGTDVILAFDTSSDVQTGSALQRIQNWADDCNLELEERTEQFHPSQARYCRDADSDAVETPAQAIESQFLGQYTRVFRGLRDTGEELFLIYCPLLPNGSNPGFDPATAPFSTSYNLIWTPAQIKTLSTTAEANLTDYSIDVIRQVMQTVYMAKRERRLATERSGTGGDQAGTHDARQLHSA
ncbi:hypothetical protein S40288_06681 [Stachybotrys chartarum IBT 40288]|nr:hypothetical protein S40288_06681 [Stachybotrys chartarum IBT 40288]